MNPQQRRPVGRLSEGEWAALPGKGQAVITGLVDENRQLRLAVSKLEEQQRRNSRNSAHPPSQDTPSQKGSRQSRHGSHGGGAVRLDTWAEAERWCRWSA